MTEYVTRVRPGTTTVRVVRPGGVTSVRTRLAAPSGTGGSFDGVHNDLTGRDTVDAHPIGSISGLQEALEAATPLDVILYLDPESLVTVGDLGGSFDGGTMSIPAFSATPIGGRLLVMSEGNANDGIWTHQGDGDFNQTVAAFQLLTADYGGLEIAYGITLSSGSSGSVRVSTTDGGTTWALIDTSSIAWTSLTDVPERITALENFRRPTLINARLHFGGEPAWEGGDPLPNLFDPDTGEFLGPIYDAAFIIDNGPLYSYNLDGSPAAPFDATDTPIIDHQPHAGGSVLATEQDDWHSNGIWTLAYDAGDGKWYGTKPTTLDWATPEMIVEGTPFWIGSGRYHRFKVGSWGFNSVQPTDPGHTWNFHRNSAADTYFDPGDTGMLAGNAQAAIEEVYGLIPEVSSEWTELARFTTASANDWPTFSSVPTCDRYRLRWFYSPTHTPAANGGLARNLLLTFDSDTTSGNYASGTTGASATGASLIVTGAFGQGSGGFGEVEFLRCVKRFPGAPVLRRGVHSLGRGVSGTAVMSVWTPHHGSYVKPDGTTPDLATWALAASNNDAWAAGITFILEGADLP